MRDQGLITQTEYDASVQEPIPTESEISQPEIESEQPYFSTWVTQQLVDRYGAGRVFGGGLKVTTTLDPQLQASAERAIASRLSALGPTASLVAIENRTGEVKAMVGGDNFEKESFNLATNGHRQPGSTIKPFTLVTALEEGISPERTYESRKKVLPYPGKPNSNFVATNYEDQYSGTSTLRDATINSDNSVYAEVGLEVGTKRIAETAERMGIQTRLSTNPAMTLGGLKEGLTPLEMAFAFSTIGNGGMRRSGTLASSELGPVAVKKVEGPDGDTVDTNKPRSTRAMPADVASQTRELLSGVIANGTGEKAQIPGESVWGKTGTTENYGDAWFAGGNDRYTVAVWVGYPDRVRPMTTEYNGQEVAGGTFPAEIWRAFMTSAIRAGESTAAPAAPGAAPTPSPAPAAPISPAPTTPQAPAPSAPPPTAAPPSEPAPPAPQDESSPPQQSTPPAEPPQAGQGATPNSSD
jgi:penicillin-binding protein 1A